MTSKFWTFDCVSSSSSRSRVAESSHWRSSTKSASGCSGRANTRMNRWKTSLKPALRLSGRQIGEWRLFSDNQLQFGDKVDHQLAVRAQRFAERRAPDGHLGVAFHEQAPDEALKRLRERRIGDPALVLIELAGSEQGTGWHQRLVQLVDDRRLADARIAGHQYQLRRAGRDDPIECGE